MSMLYGAGGGGGCFRAGTQIQLEHGLTAAIETLRVGDEVLAFDEAGEIHRARVTAVHFHEDPQPILRVQFWRGETHITPNHWVLNQYGSFVEMGKLTDHDALVDGLGHLRPILGAELVGHEPVWNLTVEPHHTFIADGIRVHNGGHRERYPEVRGAGGGGGDKGSGGRAAVEDPDSLQSRAMVAILDLLGEGQIGGLVNGAQSIFFNGTPLQNADGSWNYSGVTWDARTGTQDQAPISGFDMVATPFNEGVRVKAGQPHTVTITNPNASAVRAIVTVPSLMQQDTSTGDVHGTTVQYKFSVATNGGAFVDVPADHAWAGGGAWTTEGGVLTARRSTAGVGMQARAGLVGDGTLVMQPQALIGGAWVNLGGTVTLDRTAAYAIDPIVSYPGTQSATNDSTTVSSASAEAIRFVVLSATGVPVPVYDPTGLGMVTGAETGPAPSLSGGSIVSLTPVATCTLSGKTRSRYQRSHLIALPAGSNWQLRLTRLTADSDSSALSNETYFDSYVELVDARLSYPNSALVAVSIDSAQFNQIPNRSYLVDGLIIRVPSNYNPRTRAYTGVWDGSFKLAVSNNPAWVMYDLLTSARYGLGKFLAAEQIDKARLYQIGRYCDELVPDGYGGMEPRFTCNTVITQQTEAYKLLSDLSSVFRGMGFWNGGQVSFTQDAPGEPEMRFAPANVIDGVFTYMGSARKDRHSVALITWNDPAEQYKQKIEYVENAEMVSRYGVRKIETVAFGCTSRGQAHRAGKWMLYTEQYESDLVQFKVGLDAALVLPGDIVEIHDPFRAGKRLGGRLLACTATTATLDAPVTLAGPGARLSLRLPDGSFADRMVLEGAGEHATLTWAGGLPEVPVANGVWMLAEPNLQPMLARVVGVMQDGTKTTEFAISAVEHNPTKFGAIEHGWRLEQLKTSLLDTAPGKVSDLVVSESLYLMTPVLVGTRALLTWIGNDVRYKVALRGANGLAIDRETTTHATEFDNLAPGRYTFTVRPIGILGTVGAAAELTTEIYGKTAPPADVAGFGLLALNGAAYLSFAPAPDLDVLVGGHLRVRHSQALTGGNWNDAVDFGERIPGNSTSAVLPLLAGTYLAKWVDASGFESRSAALIVTEAPGVQAMNFIEALDEAPAFSGARTGVALSKWLGAPALMLDSLLTIDQALDNIDQWPKLSMLGGGFAAVGEYRFARAVDLGSVQTSRLTGNLRIVAFDGTDTIDQWLSIDALASIDGSNISDVSASLQVRTTDADPALGEWSGWQGFHVGDWRARAYEFRLLLARGHATHNIAVTDLSVQIDMPDRLQSGEDIACPASGLRVTFPAPFYGVPALAITGQGMHTGDRFVVSNKDRYGFDLVFLDSAGSGVARSFDYLARSY